MWRDDNANISEEYKYVAKFKGISCIHFGILALLVPALMLGKSNPTKPPSEQSTPCSDSSFTVAFPRGPMRTIE
jgi:hypothetical protein